MRLSNQLVCSIKEQLVTKHKLLIISALIVISLGITYSGWTQTSGPAASPAQAESPAEAPSPRAEGVTSATVVVVHGKIVKVNKRRKQVTLQGPEGRRVTLDVRNPYNLNAAKVGASVVARFYEIVTVRKRKPGETVPSASLSEGIVTAKPGETPGAVGERHLSLLVTVAEIDQANSTVTLKGPDGSVEKVKVRNQYNLKRVKVGDELVVSVSRVIAISLAREPVAGAS
jgi:hypothetical protein